MKYYTAITEASGLPTLMYVSPLAGAPFTPQMVESLMDIEGVIGLKWTCYDYYNMNRIKRINNGDINVLNGPDETLLCGLIMGADGGIGGVYNLAPRLFAKLYESFISGDIHEARRIQNKINPLIDLVLEHGGLTSIKEILTSIGFNMGHCTYPIKRFDENERGVFLKKLRELKYEEEYL